jgi:hypothetical protein
VFVAQERWFANQYRSSIPGHLNTNT